MLGVICSVILKIYTMGKLEKMKKLTRYISHYFNMFHFQTVT